MSHGFAIERLSSRHERSGFASGVAPLDRYLRDQAGQDERRHVAHCFVAVPEGSLVVAGFYTLAAAAVSADALPEEMRRRLPRYPQLPAALVGRLAVDQHYRGVGLGAAMIIDAGRRALESAPAVYALVVSAKDEGAAAFYRHHQFEPFVGTPLNLFLPLATFERLMRS